MHPIRKIRGLLRLSTALFAITLCAAVLPSALQAQGTRADYERADRLPREASRLVYNFLAQQEWIEGTHRLWYRTQTREGKRFVLVDAARGTKGPAFDHVRLAEALSRATGDTIEADDLPFNSIEFADDGRLRFDVEGWRWLCDLGNYELERTGRVPERGARAPREQVPAEERRYVALDSTMEAFIRDHNIWVRSLPEDEGGRPGEPFQLSLDGGAGASYVSVYWSPDSRRLAALLEGPGYEHIIHYVESSPEGQLQPRHVTREYTKPGDALPQRQVRLFDVAQRSMAAVDGSLFANQYALSRLGWWEDGRAFTFEFNQRGHQVYRVVEVDGETGRARALIEESSPTFIDYSQKRYRRDLDDGREVLWASERDGWNHLYLIDGLTGRVKNQVTSGQWVVRGVEHVDEEARQITFRASGREPGDPYLIHFYRVGFDGRGLVRLTEGDGNHTVEFSEDRAFFTDTWSRVDEPPVSVVRRASDGRAVQELERGDITDLAASGWRMPEVFTAKGRDGVTDIWGVIMRPTNFDPSRQWPVLEYIYAGPHDSFVPKSFRTFHSMQAMAELGFVVVQVDGMGTNNRGKAFHDVCWRNLKDAGLPDHILWHRAVAARYPWYDIDRGVGIYGTSAGGQSSTGALLFHPDFYTVAVSSCGCHDNRMDKIWWNEQWMGWPIGPWYAESSNVDNAWRLQGKLFLFVGEMDTNVDPASTMQVVDALIEADKDFDLLVLPGAGHTGGGSYGERRRRDFFVRHLLGVEPPDWNATTETRGPGG
ncbi:DPP IV N-terminal domain-containing protein [Gemmatimonadota bacterium]